MSKRKIFMIILSVLTVILELLPYGAVCIFMDDGGTEIRRTYSYFSLIPYGYADFSPLITALLSCVILTLCVILCFPKSQRLIAYIAVLSALATVISVCPILLGIENYSFLGKIITALLAIIFILALSVKKKESI